MFPEKDVYRCSSGWLIHKGDEIQLGSGSMPDKSFAFIKTASNGMQLIEDGSTREKKLDFRYNNLKATVKDFYIYGVKKMGYYIIARLKVGALRQDMYIENAIEARELKTPAEYATAKRETIAVPNKSKADEIKKLKELLDSGALTQDEFDTEKKKILSQ